MDFYHVDYHSINGKGKRKSIVPASSKEEAARIFTNPDDEDEFAMRFEVDAVRKIKEIPAGWDLHVLTPNGYFPILIKNHGKLPVEELERPINDTYKVKDIQSATPPRKEHVMDNYREALHGKL